LYSRQKKTLLTMPNCGFCGKLCSTEHGLKRHVATTPNCKKASDEEFGQYANSIWDNVPQAANPTDNNAEAEAAERQPLEPDMPDFQLEEDIQLAEEMFYGEDANLPLPPHQQPQPCPQHATDNGVPNIEENNDRDGARYIENFPEEHLAGATWGHSKPLFESLDEERIREGSSRWAPFEDEEEWQLAEWLIRNVGQKQTDNFLKLPIVSFIYTVFINILMVARFKNEQNPPIKVIRTF
jgi:hypothetical protein